MSYHVENFFSAVSALAGHGHIKQRLISAYEDNLDFIEEDELPVEVRRSFAELRRRMRRVTPTNGEGPICASVRKMSLDEADHCAQVMVNIYGDMIRLSDSNQSVPPLQMNGPATIPPFLVKSN